MREVIVKVAQEHGFDLQQLEVTPDHVHCFIGAPPSVSPANIARILKDLPPRDPSFRKTMRGSEHLWNPSYYVGSVGEMSREVVLNYIERQKQGA